MQDRAYPTDIVTAYGKCGYTKNKIQNDRYGDVDGEGEGTLLQTPYSAEQKF